jgi:hypothetical protein
MERKYVTLRLVRSDECRIPSIPPHTQSYVCNLFSKRNSPGAVAVHSFHNRTGNEKLTYAVRRCVRPHGFISDVTERITIKCRNGCKY